MRASTLTRMPLIWKATQASHDLNNLLTHSLRFQSCRPMRTMMQLVSGLSVALLAGIIAFLYEEIVIQIAIRFCAGSMRVEKTRGNLHCGARPWYMEVAMSESTCYGYCKMQPMGIAGSMLNVFLSCMTLRPLNNNSLATTTASHT